MFITYFLEAALLTLDGWGMCVSSFKLVCGWEWPLASLVRSTQSEFVSFVLRQLGNLVRHAGSRIDHVKPEKAAQTFIIIFAWNYSWCSYIYNNMSGWTNVGVLIWWRTTHLKMICCHTSDMPGFIKKFWQTQCLSILLHKINHTHARERKVDFPKQREKLCKPFLCKFTKGFFCA